MDSENKRLHLQMEGFLDSQPLWKGRKFELKQFDWNPEIKTSYDVGKVETPIFGKRAEVFFMTALEKEDQFEIIASNVQVNGVKSTIGELDFLLYDRKIRRHLHVELINKFYLFDPEIMDPIDAWIGPNRKDRLRFKLEKLRDHQLPLLKRPECIDLLKTMNIQVDSYHQEVCFKADLFVPRRDLKYPFVNRECIKGYWIKYSEFTKEEFIGSQYAIPEKQDWQVDPKHNDNWRNFEEIENEISKEIKVRKSPMVWQKITDEIFHRFFVVFWD